MDKNMEAERSRISREVHDQLGQIFTAIKMICRSIAPNGLASEQRTALLSAIDTGVTTARRISAELHPPLLDDLGLEPALAHYIKGMSQLSGIHCRLTLSGHEHLLEAQAIQIFRIFQEACTNVVRHAQAHHVNVTGTLLDQTYVFAVQDDGCGLDATRHRLGAMGIRGIRERADMMGGSASVAQAPEGGTRVEVRIPLSPSVLAAQQTHPVHDENTAD
jgi:signal transduction histidine kinase